MPSKSQLLRMYAAMGKARYYEHKLAKAYREGKHPKFDIRAGPLRGKMRLSAGLEPCAAEVCVHLRGDDKVTATHRPLQPADGAFRPTRGGRYRRGRPHDLERAA